jgi:putative flippase GtrA
MAEPATREHRSEERHGSAALARQFARYIAVGGLATFSHFSTLIALVETRLLSPLAASAVGTAVGACVGFTLNRRYTFAARRCMSSTVRYAACVALGLMINAVLMAGFLAFRIPYVLTQGAAIAIVALYNFAVARFYVFRHRDAATLEASLRRP